MPKTELEIVETDIRPLVEVSDWISPERGDEHYSPNQVIGSYNAGFRKGREAVDALIEAQFEKNLQRAGGLTTQVIEKLRLMSTHPISARLKDDSWREYEIVITIPQSEFIPDSFLSIYEFTGELEEREEDENFKINFRFCGEGESFNKNKMISEGFGYFHKSLE